MSFQDESFVSRINVPLNYLIDGLNGKLDGMLSHYLSTRALALDEEAQRKLALKGKYEGTYMQDSGFCRDLVEEADELSTDSDTIKSYLLISNERTRGYTH